MLSMFRQQKTPLFGPSLAPHVSTISLLCLTTLACGRQDSQPLLDHRSPDGSHGIQTADQTDAGVVIDPQTSGGFDDSGQPRLAQSPTDQVLATYTYSINPTASLAGGWFLGDSPADGVVDMEQVVPVEGAVAALKYLKVEGQLKFPKVDQGQKSSIGCLRLSLFDNVYFRENTWLRLALVGNIKGTLYQELSAPLLIDYGSWREVPTLPGSLTLIQFAQNTIKSFKGELCFQLDLSQLPADVYQGSLVVQYLRPSQDSLPKPCDRSPPSQSNDSCLPSQEQLEMEPPTPTPTPMPPAKPSPTPMLSCTHEASVLKGEQSIEIEWIKNQQCPTGNLEIGIKDIAAVDDRGQNLGRIEVISATKFRYYAPAQVTSQTKILISARQPSVEMLPATCEVILQPAEEIAVADDGKTRGLVGNLYKLPPQTAALPDFKTIKPIAQVVAGNLDIANRQFTAGFPGVKDLVEWFAIQFRGELIVPKEKEGLCYFRLTADDGANLYIRGNKTIDNDGLHPVRSREGSISLSQGVHPIQIDYYQGPRYYIALQLFWKCAGESSFTVIPPDAFVRPLQ